MDKSNTRVTRSKGKPKEKELWTINVHISYRSIYGIGSGAVVPFSVSIKPSATEEELQELIYKKSPSIKIHPSVATIGFARVTDYPGCAFNPYDGASLRKRGFYDGCTVNVGARGVKKWQPLDPMVTD